LEFRAWDLEFVWNLGFGPWCFPSGLGFGALDLEFDLLRLLGLGGGGLLGLQGIELLGQAGLLAGRRLFVHGARRTRFVQLPVAVETQKVSATLRDGVLTVKLPKAESAKPRQITVKPSISG